MKELIAKLEAWTQERGDFHSDRQLADEVLLADGWKPIQDKTFEGGVRWERKAAGMTLCSSESTRPHPLNDMNAAIGVVPFKAGWMVRNVGNRAQGLVWNPEAAPGADQFGAVSERPQVALLIAALYFINAPRK